MTADHDAAAPAPTAAPAGPPEHLIARQVLRTGLLGSLGTVGADGAPHVSYVTYATRMDGAPLFLFSGISAHTRNLLREPRFALLLGATVKPEGDPLDSARITVLGRIARADDPADRARFLRRHPAAEMYAGFKDFAIYAGAVEAIHHVGGFGRARPLPPGDVLLDVAGAAALAEAEEGIVTHMNDDHADAVQLYATGLLGLAAGPWRMTGLDPAGCDLRAENRTARVDFDRPIATAADARNALVALVKKARAAAAA